VFVPVSVTIQRPAKNKVAPEDLVKLVSRFVRCVCKRESVCVHLFLRGCVCVCANGRERGCLCVSVCMCVRVLCVFCARVCEKERVRVSVHMMKREFDYVCLYVCAHLFGSVVCVHVCESVRLCVSVHMCVRKCVCVCLCRCV